MNNNSNLFVKNIPAIQEREFKYRAPMDSHELNLMQQESFGDILDLFNKANALQKTVYEMNLANNIESTCYAKRLEAAMAKLEQLTESYNNLISTDDDFRYKTQYAYNATTMDDTYGCVIDQNTNDITAHIASSISKTRLYNETYDETLVPESLQAYVGPDSFKVGGNVYSIEDSDINNAFDGNSANIWFRKIITTPTTEEIENEIVIGLPEDIITTRLMNEIIIKTFPVGYVDIMDVKYKSNGAWQTIPGFTSHRGCTEKEANDIFGNTYTYWSIDNAGDLKFNFQNLQANQIKIKMRQRNYEFDAENNRRIWYFGLRDVDVIYNIYTRDYSVFDMVYSFQETDRNIKIYDAEIMFNNNNTSDDVNFGISKEYYYYDSSGNIHKIPSTCPFILEGHKMMIRFTIEGNQTTPNVYGCKVKYKIT